MSRNLLGAEQALLGFDARVMSLAPDATWDAVRRGLYLLRSDVQKPLSVDPMVWPSLFGDRVQVPEWRGPNQGLWDDLYRMRTSLSQLAPAEHWTIAVSWVSAEGFSKPSVHEGPYRERMTPPTIGDAWKPLGFDVADAGLTSGLSNCGYQQTEIAGLRATWASHLNEHHLFGDLKRALAFRDLTDRRVPEHAPFFVYALWLIEGQSTSPGGSIF